MRIVKGFVLVFLALVAEQCLAELLQEGEDGDVTVLTDEICSWARSGNRTEILDEIIRKLALPDDLRRVDWRTFNGSRATGICTVCKSMVKSVMSLIQNGTEAETIEDIVANLCIQLNLQTETVCRGIVGLNMPIFVYIFNADPTISPNDACGVVLQDKTCATTSDKYNWTIEIDENPPKRIESQVTNETVKIVQLTDLHYDPLYEPNGNSLCKEPTCCRKGQNVTNENNGIVAGYWGDYNDCDSPWHAVVDALTHVRDEQQEITTIYFTGDIIDHGVWETSKRGNMESLTKSYAEIKATFGDIPLYPILGNHEPHPLNVFSPAFVKDENLSTRWVYEFSADLWISHGWLPESTRQTILQGGFYTLVPRKGFRIIALNNNVCYTYNWWLILDPKDPDGQLQWLANTLLEAESNEEYVHILGHIPPGDSTCYTAWSKEFRRIVNRFAHIITGQFNGHTHFDQLNIFYDLNDSNKAINVAWNGGSLTPFTKLNPNYKVYTANANTFAIEQVDTWIYNLTAANQSPERRPEWYKSYSFKEEYGLTDLSLPSLDQWVADMSRDPAMLNAYRNNYHKYADPAISEECDSDCMMKHLCDIVTSDAVDKTKCNDFIKA